jgi:putative flippase GtrA
MTTTIDFPTVDYDTGEQAALPLEGVVVLPLHRRARHAMRHPDSWRQLFRFLCVGGSGYVVNLVVFAVSLHVLSIEYMIGFVIAFIAGTANNFWWNRHWTFDAGHHHPAGQGARFFLVAAFVSAFAFGILVVLVQTTHMEKVLAQALAYIAATPLSFVAQKLWSFKA